MKNRSDATGVLKQAEDFSEIGSTGLNHFAGEIFEEKLRALQNDRRDLIYKEMEDNDSVAGAILFVIEMLIRQVEWTVTEAD